MATDTTSQAASLVYMLADSAAYRTTLTCEQVAMLVADALTTSQPERMFIRLPQHDGGDALVRPHLVVAIMPADPDED